MLKPALKTLTEVIYTDFPLIWVDAICIDQENIGERIVLV